MYIIYCVKNLVQWFSIADFKSIVIRACYDGYNLHMFAPKRHKNEVDVNIQASVLKEAWKCNMPAFLRSYDRSTNQQTDTPTNQPNGRPANQPTDGHEGSKGIDTSNNW